MNEDLRVGVVGAGQMGNDHITRITRRISGAVVSAVIEPDEERARAATANTPSAQAFDSLEAALEAAALDAALLATPGRFHASALRTLIEARIPVLCEKPLTPDSTSAEAVLESEQRLDRPHIQVGFMRRFDEGYVALRQLALSGDAGELLMMHCAHRNPFLPVPGFSQEMLINDAVVHEFDIVPWLAGSSVVAVDVRRGRPNRLSPEGLTEPILVLMELESGVLADVEMSVSAQFGYQVATEAVYEKGVARVGEPAGLRLWQDGRVVVGEHKGFATRFARAFDAEVQQWVNAARDGRLVDGPNAWDGYRVALACEAGVAAMHSGQRVEVPNPARSAFYGG